MLVKIEQLEQEWVVAIAEAGLAEEWQNNSCCPESLQARPAPAIEQVQAPDQPGDWWPGQCVL